jgi:hypothetical protein
MYQTLSMTLVFLFVLSPIVRLVKPKNYRIILAIAILLITTLIPIQGLTSTEYLSSYLGSLSITSVVLLVLALMHIFGMPLQPSWQENKRLIMISISITFLGLYPLSLIDLSAFYPYALGYNCAFIPVLYLSLALIAVCYRHTYWPVFLLITLICILYLMKQPIGDNFWNYLIDPFVGLYALWYIFKNTIKRII